MIAEYSMIKRYLFIDRCAEGVGFITPEEGEEIFAIPFGWYNDNSTAFIEHRKNGRIIKTVNCADISVIEFENKEI